MIEATEIQENNLPFIVGKRYSLFCEFTAATKFYDNAKFLTITSNGWLLFLQPAINSLGEDTEYDLYLMPTDIKSYKEIN